MKGSQSDEKAHTVLKILKTFVAGSHDCNELIARSQALCRDLLFVWWALYLSGAVFSDGAASALGGTLLGLETRLLQEESEESSRIVILVVNFSDGNGGGDEEVAARVNNFYPVDHPKLLSD